MIQREDTLIGEGGERCHMSNRGSRRCLAHLGRLQCGQPCHSRGEGGRPARTVSCHAADAHTRRIPNKGKEINKIGID
jgi:hypothetical protein